MSAQPVTRPDESTVGRRPRTYRFEPSTNCAHAGPVTEFFDGRLVDPAIEPPTGIKTLFVCFVNRCGSNFLGSFLASTGYLNLGREVFNHPLVTGISTRHELSSYSDYCAHLLEHESRNGVLVVKASVGQLTFLARTGLMAQMFTDPYFLHIERSDVLGQAISWEVADQNNQWIHFQDKQIDDAELAFDGERIDRILKSICNQNRDFDLFFALNGIEKYAVNYEHLKANPEDSVLRIYDWLGIDNFPFRRERIYRRQNMSTKQEWRSRYLDERRSEAGTGGGR